MRHVRASWLAAILAAGCAGELENPERFVECGPGYVEQLFATKCAGVCHAGTAPEAGLDLASPGVEARLISAPSQTPFCEGRVMIDPEAADPAEHLLIDKVEADPSCGSQMPMNAEPLTLTEVECLRRWVDDVVATGGGQ